MKRFLPTIPAFLLCLFGGKEIGRILQKPDNSARVATAVSQWPGGEAYEKILNREFDDWLKKGKGREEEAEAAKTASREWEKKMRSLDDISKTLDSAKPNLKGANDNYVKQESVGKDVAAFNEKKTVLIEGLKKLKAQESTFEKRVKEFKNYKEKYDEAMALLKTLKNSNSPDQ